MRKSYLLLVAGLLSALVPAQGRVALATELEAQEEKATTAEALVALADWARQSHLRSDQLRLLHKALRLDPKHEGARQQLGYVKHDGQWMLQAKVALLEKRAHRAEMAAKGLEEIDGIWVDSAQASEATGGVFFHDGERVSLAEKTALVAGKVRHPRTGQFITSENLAKAEDGLFPLLDGSWVDQEEADRYHSDSRRPWVLRSELATVVTTLPLEKFEEVKGYVDDAIRTVAPFFGDPEVHPAYRPAIDICATVDEFQAAGNAIGDERSVYGAFVAESEPLIEGTGLTHPPAVANWGEKAPWGIYYLRNASAMAYAHSLGLGLGIDMPEWLVVGAGSFAERLYQPQIAKFFGQRHLESGGIRGLESWGVTSVQDWFDQFAISSTLEDGRVEHNIFQAGLMLSFCLHGGDDDTTAALDGFRTALANGTGVTEAADALEATLAGKETELWAYLKDVIENG